MLQSIREALRQRCYQDESECLRQLVEDMQSAAKVSKQASVDAGRVIDTLRLQHQPGVMERFLVEYGLNTDEGIALMCLAEAYLRVPDSETLDALIADKIGESDWARHLGHAQSALVNASTWALMLTGKVFRSIPAQADDLASITQGMVQRLGEPVVRRGVSEVMKILGRQFVLGRTIGEALEEADEGSANGDRYSFDMLGEAARTAEDADRYFLSYSDAISEIAKGADASDPHDNNGISVKLSALHPRYEYIQRERVLEELTPRVIALAQHAKAANIALAIDAEEANRLDLSLDIVAAILKDSGLKDWSGLGVVVQAYSKRAPLVIDWLAALTQSLECQISVRLVKGAYWDSEIKLAQLFGLPGYPVYTRKEATDVSYLACAERLLQHTDRIYPQFATHNAHSALAIEQMSEPHSRYEFQRLHGMGEALHETLQKTDKRRRRIYAPVGVHKDLLAYLVRRLLENGANSSFVNQVMNKSIPSESIAADPLATLVSHGMIAHEKIPLPRAIYAQDRKNSKGWDLNEPGSCLPLMSEARSFIKQQWGQAKQGRPVCNPANREDIVGWVVEHPADTSEALVAAARTGFTEWSQKTHRQRAQVLQEAARLYEANGVELMALAVREAGKTWSDAIAELREAVDFLRYYALQTEQLPATVVPDGVVVSISPWNFPLAIFTGQMSGALAPGNAVIVKPAEQTPLLAARAVSLLHEAGVPANALLLAQGDGATIGAALTANRDIAGVCFTGSNETARLIDINMAQNGNARAGLMAETGGINAMIVDSTALLEQVVRDILTSAFQSAGQRCSAARVVYIQRDIAEDLISMLRGAMQQLTIGDPWQLSTDVGPVIDQSACDAINQHCERLTQEGRLICRSELPAQCQAGTFVAPTVFRLDNIRELRSEVFGPVLHVIEFDIADLDKVVDEINSTGYGLTFGIHSRIDTRVDSVCARVKAGNLYVNRNQIGAVVGVQPFGGERLSGTGPKAGGPLYVRRFTHGKFEKCLSVGNELLVGPTGERNSYMIFPRGKILCLGPDASASMAQKKLVEATGNTVFEANLDDDISAIVEHNEIEVVLFDGDDVSDLRARLARCEGARRQILSSSVAPERLLGERSVSEDTTASGGNASLLAAVS